MAYIYKSMLNIQKLTISLLICFAGCTGGENRSSITKKKKDDIGNVMVTDLKGQFIDLKRYRGKTVFINFWATWCKPCIREMPSIDAARKVLDSDDVVFLVASDESEDEILEFKAAHSYTFEYVRIENSEELKVQALPTTFIFNSRGELSFSEAGYRKWNDQGSIDIIQKIIKEK